MAENERLDVLKNPRWLRVMRFIASGPQEGEIPRRLTEAMYRTLRSVGKQIPLEDLLKAAANRDPVDLESLRADLFQIARLAELSSHGLPAWFSRHLYGSCVVQTGDLLSHGVT